MELTVTDIKPGDFVRLTDPLCNGQIVRIENDAYRAYTVEDKRINIEVTAATNRHKKRNKNDQRRNHREHSTLPNLAQTNRLVLQTRLRKPF